VLKVPLKSNQPTNRTDIEYVPKLTCTNTDIQCTETDCTEKNIYRKSYVM